ncbi:hypothetical protein U1Q18_049985 [Sarracenia purpurea var. burkii]
MQPKSILTRSIGNDYHQEQDGDLMVNSGAGKNEKICQQNSTVRRAAQAQDLVRRAILRQMHLGLRRYYKSEMWLAKEAAWRKVCAMATTWGNPTT